MAMMSAERADGSVAEAAVAEHYLLLLGKRGPWHVQNADLDLAARRVEHLLGLLNYFVHPITTALTEGWNSRIPAIKDDARGFRRFPNYRVPILFFCGKLNLLPDLVHPSTNHTNARRSSKTQVLNFIS